jgi:uncharacterized protein YyaL (SSP411 family)
MNQYTEWMNMNTKESLSYSWGEEAFSEAKRDNKPLFVWISQKGSYWCDTMSRESLGSPDIQQILSDEYITIVVDAIDRPDIARYYQKLHEQMVGRSVGYPICLFLTDEKIPLFVSGFIPAKSSDGISSFEQTLRLVSSGYSTKLDELVSKGNKALGEMKSTNKNIEATHIDKQIVNIVKEQIVKLSDTVDGGFGDKPKYPRHTVLSLIIDILYRDDDKELTEILTNTLDIMLDSTLLDKTDNAFHHYCLDTKWSEPYRGKSLANNAQMITLLTRAYQKTSNERYKNQAISTYEFVVNKLGQEELFTTLYDDGLVDDAIISADNAMMVSAIIDISILDEKYLPIAKDIVATMLNSFMRDGVLYHTTLSDSSEAFLDDYAWFGTMLLKIYQATGDEQYAVVTSEIINEAIRRYFNHGVWRYNIGELSTLAIPSDIDRPSEIATMTILLNSASKLINPEYEKFAKRTIELNSYQLMRQPISMPELCRVSLNLI